jgi:hypothetical protein
MWQKHVKTQATGPVFSMRYMDALMVTRSKEKTGQAIFAG